MVKPEDLDKPILADKVTDGIGSGKFIIAQTVFLVVYLCWNTMFPTNWRFDGAPFILLNLLLSFQAGYTGPVVLWSQNRSAKRDRQVIEKMNHAVSQIFKLDKRHDKDMREMNAKIDILSAEVAFTQKQNEALINQIAEMNERISDQNKTTILLLTNLINNTRGCQDL